MRETSLPIEFSGLSGKVNYVQRVNPSEYSSSCPQCGGAVHKNGDYPDRFRMFLNANGKNKVMGWCRHCSYVWFPDKETPVSAEEFERWRKEQIERERKIKEEAEKAIELLKSQKIWEKYHAGLSAWAIETIESWGITKEYADYWQLGFVPDYVVYGNEDPYHSPAISIPNWQMGWEIQNVKLRVLNPKSSADRYRSVYKVGTAAPFVAFPDLKADTCILVEGEKKAMVTAEFTEQKFQVIGIPTKTPRPDSLHVLDGFGKIIVCLDPDAKKAESNAISPLQRLVGFIGPERVEWLDLPGKIDDMIVRNGLNIFDALRYRKKWR